MTATDTRHDKPPGAASPRVPHRRLILSAAAVVVVAILAGWLVAFSSVFGVSRIIVRGEHQLSEQQVLAAADIASGTPLLRLDTASVRARLDSLPDVASAQVSTSFPSTVTISITERVAVGVVRSVAGFVLVDRTGDQFRSVPRRPSGLPLFVIAVGPAARSTGSAVATVAAALPTRLLARVASIQALDPHSIGLLLTNGRVVQWGSVMLSAAKARILPALLQQPGTRFDVIDPAQPYAH